MRGRERRSLAELAADSGVPVACAGNLPLEMDDPDFVWFIDEGAADLFLVERRDGVEQSAPQHLLRAEAGRLLPGVAPQEEDTVFELVAKGLPGTVLRRLPAASLTAARDTEVGGQVDAWITDVSAILSRDTHRPRPDVLVEPGEIPSASGGTLSARRGVVWVSEPPRGAGLFLSLIDFAEGRPDGETAARLPLTPVTWLTLTEGVQLSTCSSESLAGEGVLLSALHGFHAAAFSLERLNRRLAVVDQANVVRAGANNRRSDEEGARHGLFNLYGLSRETDDEGAGDSALREALQLIGRHEGIDFKWPPATGDADSPPLLGDILDASGVRGRRVRLAAADSWWATDCGAMLAFRADDGRPVALLPSAIGNYREIGPGRQGSVKVTAERAASLRPDAWLFYRPLSSSGVGPRELLRAAGKGLAPDIVRIAAAGLLAGLVMLLPAVFLGFIADRVIPVREAGLLHAAVAALAVFALLGALLQVLQGMALMRFESRVTSRVEAGFWDRLLRLPARFLHRFPAGELAMRGMMFQGLRDAVQGVVANAVLSIVFLAPALVLIFLYDAGLGGLTAAVALLSLVVTVMLGLRQVSPHRRVLHAGQRLAGRLFQLISGITRLRIGRAEGSAFAVWARDYREQKRAELDLGAVEVHLKAFGAALPLLSGAVLLLAATGAGRPGIISSGDFLAVFTLFLLFQAAVVRLGASFGAVASAIPAFEQIRPFLGEPPEMIAEGEPVENLGGDIVFDHVSFRHDPDGPLILDDVSIQARPGEFIAIAGESGAGKSTVFRLALGLERPTAGSVYYDGRDLRHLNLKQVRRRIGVVPQHVRLHPQDLWDNIVGDHEDATGEEAWEAARLAAVDHPIAEMPMGMLTPVGTSASVTSGGESQRIMIAHALLRNPRVLLLDEATNWLDNDSQARIMENLAGLASTRIVIAHRLSTLRHADRIYVLQSGRVVQEGSFAELTAAEGVFRDLMRRQMA